MLLFFTEEKQKHKYNVFKKVYEDWTLFKDLLFPCFNWLIIE